VDWLPGEHLTVIGRAGRGKTHFVDRLLREQRRYVVVFKTKHDPEDDTRYWRGYKTITRASGMSDQKHTRFLLAPPLGKVNDPAVLVHGRRVSGMYAQQAIEGWAMIRRVFKEGRWTVVVDEGWYAEHYLGMTEGIEMLQTQARSKGVSVVECVQRPVEISRFVLAEATHLVVFRGDRRDSKTIGDASDRDVGDAVATLRGHDFIYHNSNTSEILRGNSNRLPLVFRPAAERLAGALAGALPGERP
jgi:hypothetical protein